jgi:hypothetical protein
VKKGSLHWWLVAVGAASMAIAAGLWVTSSSDGLSSQLEYDHPFLQGYELGASPSHPDEQLFTRGSDLFLSSIYLWSDALSRVTLTRATLVTGACAVKPIEDKVATLSPHGPVSASYIPFGYGSIHVWEWELSEVHGFQFAPRERGLSFLVFSFSDPMDCPVHVRAIDIAYSTRSGMRTERLDLGGVDFIPTAKRGYYGTDVPR